MSQPEIKKMKQGMSYSCKEKTIILNVFKYFRLLFPEKCVTDIVRHTSKATGCSEKSVFRFRKEETSAEGFKVPSTTKIRKNININSRDIKYDDTVRQAIRTIIYDLKYRKIVPSLSTILKDVNANPQLPNLSLMTLRRLMFDMGFRYEKTGNKSILVEKTPSSSIASGKSANQKRGVHVSKQPTSSIQDAGKNPLQKHGEPPFHYMPHHDNKQMSGGSMHHPHPYNMPVMLNHHHHVTHGHSNVNSSWPHHPNPHQMKQE